MRKLRKKLAGGLVLALAIGSSAVAAPHDPKGEFENFGECPLDRKTITECLYSISNSGSVTIGDKTLLITKPIALQGGLEEDKQEGKLKFFGAEGGETLSKTAQEVPSGLIGVATPTWWPSSFQGWFDEQVADGLTGVKATIELAAPATSIELSTENLLNRKGTALGLPVKIKLDNPLLGSNCYIGSDSEPIQIDLSTGKSGAVEGSPGNVDFNEDFTFTKISNGRLANGTFAAPKAEGCGGIFSAYIDPLVDSMIGLPSPSGENTAILIGTLEGGNAAAVKESE